MSQVLLVDDNALFRLGLREVIKSAQPEFSVVESESLLAARAILREHANIALVILDIKVHDCGGFVGLFELRKEFPSIPVVVCSANVDSESVSRAVAFGAAGYISKSAPCDVIARMLKTSLVGEPDNNQGPKSIWTWFARDDSRPLMFFAGIWREWEGDRGTKKVPDVGRHLVFSFLTTDASPDVASIHPDATPVLLLDEPAREQWMTAPWEIARDLQKPPPAGSLKVVATGKKEDS